MEKARVLNLKLGIGIGMFQGLANVALNGRSYTQLKIGQLKYSI